MQLMRLSQRVADWELSESGTFFFSIVQRYVEEENSEYNCVNTPKNTNASVEDFTLSTTTKLSE